MHGNVWAASARKPPPPPPATAGCGRSGSWAGCGRCGHSGRCGRIYFRERRERGGGRCGRCVGRSGQRRGGQWRGGRAPVDQVGVRAVGRVVGGVERPADVFCRRHHVLVPAEGLERPGSESCCDVVGRVCGSADKVARVGGSLQLRSSRVRHGEVGEDVGAADTHVENVKLDGREQPQVAEGQVPEHVPMGRKMVLPNTVVVW